MKKPKENQSTKVANNVNNNPEYDRSTIPPEEIALIKKLNKSTLYDSSYYRTYAGHWKQRDEPSGEEQLKQADAINQLNQKRRAAAARQRLKDKNAVPIKGGKKLFNSFMEEARQRSRQSTINTKTDTAVQ